MPTLNTTAGEKSRFRSLPTFATENWPLPKELANPAVPLVLAVFTWNLSSAKPVIPPAADAIFQEYCELELKLVALPSTSGPVLESVQRLTLKGVPEVAVMSSTPVTFSRSQSLPAVPAALTSCQL